MNNIGLTLTADTRAMIKALQDAEKAMASMGQDMAQSLKQVQAQASQTGQVMSGMANPNTLRGMAQLNKQMGDLGMSTKATTAALRQVPAQFTDIIVSLQGGQAPLTVLLQQGGQLKDVFGGIGPAARALGGYVLGLINPFTLAAAAVGVLGLAYKQGSDEADAFRKSLLLTGSAAGTTVDQLAGMAASMDETFGVTTGKAADALSAMAGTGRIARTSLQDFAQVAIDVEKSFGQSIEDTAKNFAELGKDPVGASKRLNESLNYLTAATYAQIKAAVDLGETEKAAAIAQDAYAKAMKGRSDTVVKNLGYIEHAYLASLSWAKEAWDAILGIGRAETTTEKMKDVRKELDLIDQGLRNVSPRQRAALEQQLAALQETEKIAKLAGDRQAERVATENAGIAAIDQAEKDREKNRRAAEDAAKKAAKEAADARKQELEVGELRNKLAEENAKREAKNLEDTAKLHAASVKPFEQSLKAQQDRVKSLETEEAAIRLSETLNVSLGVAVEMVNIAKLKEKQIDARGNEEAVAVIQKEIEVRQKLVDLVARKEGREASAKAAKKAADDWQKAADKIQDSITDSLMRGFESGKGFVQNLVGTIKNMFNTMVLRPVVQAAVGSGLSAIGLGGASSASASTLGGLTQSVLGNFAQSAIGTSIISSSAAYGAAIGTTSIGAGSQAAMLAAQTSGFGAAGTLATAQAAGTGSSMMASAAAAGPYVAAALVALNALGAFRSKKIVGGGLTGTLGEGTINTYDLQRRGGTLFNGPSYSIQNVRASDQSQAIQDAFLAMRAATAGMAQQLGLANKSILSFTTRLGNDLIHPDTGGYGIKLDGLNPEQAAAKVQAALESANEQMARMLLGTFETVTTETGRFFKKTQTVTNWIGGPMVREGETATQALMRLSSSLSNVNTVLETLNHRLMDSSLAGADLSSALIDVFGGVDNFRAVTGAYYDAIYSQEEKLAKTTQNLTKALAALGMSMPPTIQAYRDLVQAQDLTTVTGRNTYAALIQLAPVFAQVANAAEGLVAKLGRLVGVAADELTLLASRQIEASQEAAEAARDAAEQFKDAGLMLREAARAILGATGRAAINTAASYAQGLAAARGGDLASIQALPELANAMLAEQRSRAATRVEANLAAARTATELNEVAKLAEAAGAQKSYQAKLYDVNTAMLEVLRSTLQSGEVTSESMAQQLQALQNINGLISGSVDIQSDTLDVTEIAAIATAGSQTLLDAVLGQLRVPDASAEFLNASILSGNTLVAGKIEVLIAAVNKQTADQQAEVRRQQDLLKAQAELESAGVTAENLKAVAAQASQALAQTSRTIEVYLGRGGKIGTGSKRYRYDPNPAYDTAAQAALDAEIAAQSQLQELERLRQTIRDLGGIPAFATGGTHAGGIRLVGENGPELEVTGPARIYNAQQTASMLSGGGDVASEVRAVREEMAMLRAEARATAINTGRQADLMKRVTRNGEAMTVQTDSTPLEVTTA